MLRGFRIRSAIAAVATVCVASAVSAPARAEATRVGGVYGVLFSGIPIARATFSLVIDGDAYSLKIKMRPAAVGRAVSSGTVDAEAAGWYKNGALIRPASPPIRRTRRTSPTSRCCSATARSSNPPPRRP